MKHAIRTVIFTLLTAASALAQGEVLNVYHGAGPMYGAPTAGPPFLFPQLPNQVSLGLSQYGQLAISRNDPPFGGSMGAGVPIPILTAVTGSGTPQSVNIATTSFMGDGQFWIIDGGTATQEVVLVNSGNIIDATHVTIKSQNSHIVGAPMLQVFSVLTRFLVSTLNMVPGTGLTNFNFIRYGPLQPNVYDQYIIRGSYGTWDYTEDDVFPWILGFGSTPSVSAIPLIVPQYSSASISSTGNPTNAISLYSSSITGSGGIYPEVQIQLLFTTTPEPSTSTTLYRYWWDE